MSPTSKVARLVVWSLGAAAGCSSEKAAGPAPLPVCSSALLTQLALAVGAYTSIDPSSDSGCVAFAHNPSTTDSAEYLVIPQSAGGTPGDSAPFRLRNATLSASAAATPLLVAASARGRGSFAARLGRGPIARAFDHFLRELGRRVRARAALRPPARAPVQAAAPPVPPTVGSLRTFTVCATFDCSAFQPVTGRVRSVGAHVAIYVDMLAPANGLDSADIDTLQQVSDTHVYAVDTAAFGGVSDIDTNGVVIALMTNVVNRMVTAAQCASGGFVAGFFFPPDLVGGYNNAEIFYTVVADPSGTLSCPHTPAEVKSFIPGTFLHELQHLISFNQHVLVHGGNEEDLWLDEALSSYAEELGGRSFLPDSATFSQYLIGDVFNAYQYLADPGSHFLLQTSDTVLADFGAGWLYVRYLVDQFGASLTTKLEATALTGTDNVAAHTGFPFATTAARWALANWVSDLPGFMAPPELQYTSWSFRAVFASLNAQDPTDFPAPFPLVPVAAAGGQVNIAGTLYAGSGTYVRALQRPDGAGFTLFLSDSSGAVSASIVPRLDVIRIR